MKTCVAAATCSINNNDVNIDANLENEKVSSGLLTFAFLKDPYNQIVMAHTTGSFSEGQYSEGMELALAASSRICKLN